MNVVEIVPISGRFRAAARNFVRLLVRNGTSLPARSSRTNESLIPTKRTPGIAGSRSLKGCCNAQRLTSVT